VAEKVLNNIDGIAFSFLTNKDVVRHPLVQKIVTAYDEYEKVSQPSALKKKTDRKPHK